MCFTLPDYPKFRPIFNNIAPAGPESPARGGRFPRRIPNFSRDPRSGSAGRNIRLPARPRLSGGRADVLARCPAKGPPSSLPKHSRAENHQHKTEDAGQRLVAEGTHEIAAIPRGDRGGHADRGIEVCGKDPVELEPPALHELLEGVRGGGLAALDGAGVGVRVGVGEAVGVRVTPDGTKLVVRKYWALAEPVPPGE